MVESSSYLLRSVKVCSPGHRFHDSRVDMLIENGRLTRIETHIAEVDVPVLVEGCSISPGWVEMRSRCTDPGLPNLEDLPNLLAAAAAGGFSFAGVLPSTQPPIDSVEKLRYWTETAKSSVCGLLPIAALTKGLKGAEMSNHFELIENGAVALSDDFEGLADTYRLRIALQYAAQLGKPVLVRPEDPFLKRGILANEGEQAVLAGLSGVPGFSELVGLERLLRLAEDTGCRLHFCSISTPEALDRIRTAKKAGLSISCDVAIAHLIWDDSVLSSFDSELKTDPPLRTLAVQRALIEACLDGTVDAVSSDHRPLSPESKNCEFAIAEPGMALIQVLFPLLNEALGDRATERIFELLCAGPRAIFGLNIAHFEASEEADYTLFDPGTRAVFDERSWVSGGSYTPLLQRIMHGKALGVIRGNRIHLNSNTL